jgi:hypothetical protein
LLPLPVFGRMIKPWFTRPLVRADDASAKHLRGATGERAQPQRTPGAGVLAGTVSVTLRRTARLCSTPLSVAALPPERSHWRFACSAARVVGCALSVACCALRAGGLICVLQATWPVCSIALSNVSCCTSCVQAPCSTWLNLSWYATLRATIG